jgi:hypothetical protein
MIPKSLVLAYTVVAFVFVSAPSIRADVLVSNLAEPLRSSTPMGNNPNPNEPPQTGPWYWAAQSFTTDANVYTLESIDAIVGEASFEPAPIVVAELRADDEGTMSTLLATFTSENLGGPLAAHNFIPDSQVELQPDTNYWFVLGVAQPGDGTFHWGYIDSNESSGPGVIANYADSDDSGATFVYRSNDFPYYLQVNVEVPSDYDGDDIDDVLDVCCNTPAGAAVDAQGRPLGDLDLDCDTDLDDYLLMQRGFTGPLTDPAECPAHIAP